MFVNDSPCIFEATPAAELLAVIVVQRIKELDRLIAVNAPVIKSAETPVANSLLSVITSPAPVLTLAALSKTNEEHTAVALFESTIQVSPGIVGAVLSVLVQSTP